MKYGCYMINFDYTEWFDSEAEAIAFGKKSGFQFIIRSIEDF